MCPHEPVSASSPGHPDAAAQPLWSLGDPRGLENMGPAGQQVPPGSSSREPTKGPLDTPHAFGGTGPISRKQPEDTVGGGQVPWNILLVQKKIRLATRVVLRGHSFLPDSSARCPEPGSRGHGKGSVGPPLRTEPARIGGQRAARGSGPGRRGPWSEREGRARDLRASSPQARQPHRPAADRGCGPRLHGRHPVRGVSRHLSHTRSAPAELGPTAHHGPSGPREASSRPSGAWGAGQPVLREPGPPAPLRTPPPTTLRRGAGLGW